MKVRPAKQPGKVLVELNPDTEPRIASALMNGLREAPSPKIKRILATTDFSELSMEAIEYAVVLAEQFGATLSLIYVVEPSPSLAGVDTVIISRTDPQVVKLEKARLAKLAKQLSRGSRKIKPVIRTGKPFREIAAEAREQKVDLIVTGTHGHSGLKRVLLGSTAEWVVRHAPCPVLTVPAETADRLSGTRWVARINKIVVPIDFSETSAKALPFAAALAAKFRADIALIHVTAPLPSPSGFDYIPSHQIIAASNRSAEDMLSTVQREAFPDQIRTEAIVRSGTPFHEITRAATRLEADLIILTTHGWTGLKHALMGSTAERIVRHANCPVLIVRDTEISK